MSSISTADLPEPTGDCYRGAGRYVLDRHLRNEDSSSLTLVHALVHGTGPLEGFAFGHAWVEHATTKGKSIVIDCARDQPALILSSTYRHVARVIEEFRYSPEDVRLRVIKHGHWGPWEGRLSDLSRAAIPLAELAVDPEIGFLIDISEGVTT